MIGKFIIFIIGIIFGAFFNSMGKDIWNWFKNAFKSLKEYIKLFFNVKKIYKNYIKLKENNKKYKD